MGGGIAVAGTIALDIIKNIQAFPERNGLVKILKKTYALGGMVNNTGRDLASLDPSLPVQLIGLIGTDAEGDEILRQLRMYSNIDTSMIKRRGYTAFTDVLAEEKDNIRSFLYYGGAGDCFDCQHVPIDRLDCDIFHIGYILLMKQMDSPDPEYGTRLARTLHDVQAKGIRTSVDIVSETGNRYKDIVPPALRYTDYLIANEIESEKTTGIPLRESNGKLLIARIPAALEALKVMGVKRWAIIHAPEGGFGIDEAGQYFRLPSLRLPDKFIAGTVGAGDAFCAGVLYAAYQGAPLLQGLEDGIAAAACSLRSTEASASMEPIANTRALYTRMPKRSFP